MVHVLIIEDEWLVADHLTYLAECAGATSVVTACTEDDAVQAAHERRPGIILSDVTLQAGTGPRAIRTIMADLGEIPVIFITATPEDCASCATTNVVLQKPVDPAHVMATFRRLAPL